MKKQLNPTIKAHLIRSAFYLLLLVAVCAIPFALAQSRSRGTNKQSLAKMDASANKYMAQVAQRTDGAVSDQPLPNISHAGRSFPRLQMLPVPERRFSFRSTPGCRPNRMLSSTTR